MYLPIFCLFCIWICRISSVAHRQRKKEILSEKRVYDSIRRLVVQFKFAAHDSHQFKTIQCQCQKFGRHLQLFVQSFFMKLLCFYAVWKYIAIIIEVEKRKFEWIVFTDHPLHSRWATCCKYTIIFEQHNFQQHKFIMHPFTKLNTIKSS